MLFEINFSACFLIQKVCLTNKLISYMLNIISCILLFFHIEGMLYLKHSQEKESTEKKNACCSLLNLLKYPF